MKRPYRSSNRAPLRLVHRVEVNICGNAGRLVALVARGSRPTLTRWRSLWTRRRVRTRLVRGQATGRGDLGRKRRAGAALVVVAFEDEVVLI